MKATVLSILAVLGLFTSVAPAQAALVEALKVTADYFPDNHYAIGFDLNEKNLIQQIYFQDYNGNKTFYTLDTLENNYQGLFNIAGIDVVQLHIASHTGLDKAQIELRYVTNAVVHKSQSIFFNVSLNPSTQKYDIFDLRDNAVIHSANVVTHYIFRAAVGISEIDTE